MRSSLLNKIRLSVDIVLSMNTTQSVREFTSAALERNTSIEIVKDDDEQTRLDQLRKQRQYNGKHIDAYHQRQEVQFELVLESDPHTLEPIIEVPLSLVLEMKSHQSKKKPYPGHTSPIA